MASLDRKTYAKAEDCVVEINEKLRKSRGGWRQSEAIEVNFHAFACELRRLVEVIRISYELSCFMLKHF